MRVGAELTSTMVMFSCSTAVVVSYSGAGPPIRNRVIGYRLVDFLVGNGRVLH